MNKRKIICNLLMATIIAGAILQASAVDVLASSAQASTTRAEQKLTHSNGLRQYSYSDNSFKNLQYMDVIESTNLELANDSTKSVKWVGYINPAETGNFEFAASGADIFINGMPVVSNGQAHAINMEKGKYYKIEIRCNVETKENRDSIKLYWTINNGEKTEIPVENIKTTVDKSELPTEYRMRAASDATNEGDGDSDGIPDELEMNGVAYFRGKLYAADSPDIKQYVDNGQVKTYKTSPNAMSTDGDPYTDLDEIKQTTIVKSETNGLGGNPLIAAAPIIRLNVKNISVTPNGQMSFTDGTTLTSSVSSSVTTTETKDVTQSGDIGFNMENLFNFRFGYKRDVKNSTSTATAEVNGVNLGYDFKSATTVNAAEAAYLNLEMEYQNIGTAAAHNVNPNFSIKLGNDTIFTVQPSDNTKEELLKPNETSIAKNIGYFGSKDQKIPLSLSQLQRVRDGEKLTIVYDQEEIAGQALLSLNPSKLESWSNYFSGINQCASIDLRVQNRQVQSLKIYAASEDGFVSGDPEITLKEALERLYNYRVEGDKTLISYTAESGVKKDVQVNDNMIIAFDPNTAESIKVQLSNNKDVNTVKLRPGMSILLSTTEQEVGTQAVNRDVTQAELSTEEGRRKVITELENQLKHPIQSLKVEVIVPGEFFNVPLTWGGYTTTLHGQALSSERVRAGISASDHSETIEIAKGNFVAGMPSLGGNEIRSIDSFPETGGTINNDRGHALERTSPSSGKSVRPGEDLKIKIVGVTADMSASL